MVQPKKQNKSWDEIGDLIGKKIGENMGKCGEKSGKAFEKDECCSWKTPWMAHPHKKGGGIGRFIFITALLYILNLKEYLIGIPWWALVLLIIGFTFMRI